MNSFSSAFGRLRALALSVTILGMTAPYPQASDAQQLIPIIRQTGAAPAETSVLNAYLKTGHWNGCTYVSLEQVSSIFGGHVHWHRVARQADLDIHGHAISFLFNSTKLKIDGRPARLSHPCVHNDQGVWVPAAFFATHRFFQLSHSRLDWSAAAPASAASAPPAARPAIPVAEPVPAAPAAPIGRSSRHAIRRIVIDPGHGGKDPGTVGARGMEEKTLNLLIAKDLADRLREENYEVLLTRTDDTFIPLAERARLANSHDADLFISIHCNASLSPTMNGVEVYFLSETASDPHADAVARAENASLALENKTPTPDQVQSVLRSLVKTAYINEGSTLGAWLERDIGQSLRSSSVSVKQAGFYVLRGAEMPAVLIETGFLTNKREEKKLLDDRYRKQLVKGIAEAILTYDARKSKEALHS